MEQRILFLIIFILNFIFLIFFAQKFLPLLEASLINSNPKDLVLKLKEISQKLDKISFQIENLNSKLENSKIDFSPISKEILNLKNQIQKTRNEIAEESEKESILSKSKAKPNVKKEA
jgi:peptidoglycan hydrolase CwlO-like protein